MGEKEQRRRDKSGREKDRKADWKRARERER